MHPYTHTSGMCVYTHTHTQRMPTTPTDTTSTHTARAIYTNITPHTKHKGLNSRHRPPIHSTMPHTHCTTYTPYTHAHSICTPHPERRCPHTQRCYSIHTKTMFLTDKYTILHILYPPHTKHQRANTRHLPPPPPCHTHSHTQLQHTHHKNHSYTSTHLSLFPRLL